MWAPDNGRREKGKGKGKTLKRKYTDPPRPGSNIPDELEKYRAKIESGPKVCYKFNLDGCQEGGKKGGGKGCTRGAHVCMKCGLQHTGSALALDKLALRMQALNPLNGS